MCERFDKAKIKKLKVKDLCAQNANILNLSATNSNLQNATIQTETVATSNIQNATIQTETVATSNIQNATIQNATIQNFSSQNGSIENLQVTTINGTDINCGKNFRNENAQLITENYFDYPPNSGFDEEVWNRLVIETNNQMNSLAARIQCGRLEERAIQLTFGCDVCPPTELDQCFPNCDNPGDCPCQPSGNCPSVPLKIKGIKSVAPFKLFQCGSSIQQQTIQLISTISYNLDVINISGTLATRVVSVLVQAGWLDENNQFQYEQIDFANRQFGATLDTAYGEKFTGTVVIPTDLATELYDMMPDDADTAVIQLVVFYEDGVEIDVNQPSFSRRSKRKLRRQALGLDDPTPAANGPVDTQYQGQSVGGQLQWSNIYSLYDATIDQITSIETTFVLNNNPPSTQWVMGWTLDGPPIDTGSPGGYFGINTDDQANFQVLGSIFNAALDANAEQSYVTKVNFGGEGVGWSLRITQDNISNFPINLGQTYKLRLNRRSLDTVTTWEFIIANVTESNQITLGTITTKTDYQFISKGGLYQFSEYYGKGPPDVTCQTIPLSVINWTFIIPNDNPDGITYTPWTPPPQHCGEFQITPDLNAKTVVMSFGCTTC